MTMPISTNRLYYGDNLNVLRNHEYFPSKSVDLIYLDPPFNSARTYNVLFRDESGLNSDAQMAAFGDTWHWGESANQTYYELVHGESTKVADVVGAMRTLVGTNQMLAYLVMMTARLVELHRVLKPTGSLYLHCDPTASHYLKLILDAIFGIENYRSEIIWKRTSAHNSAKRPGPIHDVIFFYTKSATYTWNDNYTPYDEQYVRKFYRHAGEDGRLYQLGDLTGAGTRNGETGQLWQGIDVTAKGRHWMRPPSDLDKLLDEGRIYVPEGGGMPRLKRYLDEMQGVSIQDVWDDIPPVQSHAKERTGYPTQKPLALLERIILSSSNPGEVVLDPFSGCGTAVTAAHKLGRRWAGIDITHLAITVIKHQLQQQLDIVAGKDYQIIGEPQDVGSARELASQDRHQFEWWAISLVGAKPMNNDDSAVAPGGRAKGKKGADKGIDGFIPFVEANGKPSRVLISVKSGDNLGVAMVRDLRGTLERENAAMALLITLSQPTKPMLAEASDAGVYESHLWKQKYPRIQIATIESLLKGVSPKLPPMLNPFVTMQRVDKENPEDKTDLLL